MGALSYGLLHVNIHYGAEERNHGRGDGQDNKYQDKQCGAGGSIY